VRGGRGGAGRWTTASFDSIPECDVCVRLSMISTLIGLIDKFMYLRGVIGQ
jgi:hypothetical protein